MQFDVRGDVSKIERRLNWLQRQQLPFAMSKALNDTIQDARLAEREAMLKVFDRPTDFTLNSVLYRKATKQDLRAYLFLRNEATKGTSPAKYLQAEIHGGGRNTKRIERLLQFQGLLPQGMYLMPAKGLPLDANGNIPRGIVQRVLADIGANLDTNTKSTAKTRRRGRRQTRYFAIYAQRGRLPPGIYERWGGKAIRGVFMFVKRQPQYRVRFDFKAIADRTVKARFRGRLFDALRYAIKTAR